MPNKPKRIYWDACVFISLVSGDEGRVEDVVALMDAADKGDLEILTSEMSVVEVAYLADEIDEDSGEVPADVSEEIETLWTPPSPVRRVELSSALSREARRLIRATKGNGTRLGAADAIHLATAKQLGVDEIHTYENEAHRTHWAALVGIPVCAPLADAPQLGLKTPTAPTPTAG